MRVAARPAASRAWHGLIRVLIGAEPAPTWRWRSPQERRAAYAVLGMATLALCLINAGTVHGVSSMHGPLAPSSIQLPPVPWQRLLAAVDRKSVV